MPTNQIQIYPVIEMSPWRVDGTEGLDLKPGQEYEDFAIEIFKKHGIEHIDKLDPYAYSSIKLSDIVDDNDLKILIEKELDDAEIPENETELIGAFDGGLNVMIGNKNVIHHECCGKISDYKKWQNFLKKSPEDWYQIWIGHPWVYGRIKGEQIELSDYIEHTGRLDIDLPVHIQMNKDEFISQLNLAIEEIMVFKKRILAILRVEMNEIAEEVTELLIENVYKK